MGQGFADGLPCRTRRGGCDLPGKRHKPLVATAAPISLLYSCVTLAKVEEYDPEMNSWRVRAALATNGIPARRVGTS